MSEMRIVVCPILTPVFVLTFERISEPDLRKFYPCRFQRGPADREPAHALTMNGRARRQAALAPLASSRMATAGASGRFASSRLPSARMQITDPT